MSNRSIRGNRLILEGFVVVVSILVASALDAWWNRRTELRTEKSHLRSLQSDFRQNVARLETLIALEESVADASLRLLAASSRNIPSPEDSLANLLGRVFNSSRFDPVVGAYEAVVGSGGLAQVQDDSLRLELADFASLVDRNYTERYSDELYFDFIRTFTGQLGFAQAALTDGAELDYEVAEVRRLLSDAKFREHLALRYFAERDVGGSYRRLLEKAQRVLTLIDRALQ